MAVIVLSNYSIDSKKVLSLALSLEGKVDDKPIPQFLFQAFQECLKSGPSLRLKEGDKIMVSKAWIDQKAKWSDTLIAEVSAYRQIKGHLNNGLKAADEFFFTTLIRCRQQ